MWKLIEGYFWRYRINEEGQVEREVRPDVWRPIASYLNNPRKQLRVHLKRKDGKRVNVTVKRLMANAFFGDLEPGQCLTVKNRMVTDCSLSNLKILTIYENGKRLGGGGRRSVEKVDRDGNVIDLYKSITEAAKKNFISRKSVYIRCAKKMRGDPFELTGYSFQYECDPHTK